MKTIPQAVSFLAQHFRITPEQFVTLSHCRTDIFKKRITQMLLREVFERNATYQAISDNLGGSVGSIHQSIETGYGWIRTGYTEFVEEYKSAKIEFINWINN
jgi:hypothetical protein